MAIEKTILKVQVALFSNDEVSPPALVYNHDKSFLQQVPATEDLLKAMDGRSKAYFEAEIHDGIGFKLIQEAKWQVW